MWCDRLDKTDHHNTKNRAGYHKKKAAKTDDSGYVNSWKLQKHHDRNRQEK